MARFVRVAAEFLGFWFALTLLGVVLLGGTALGVVVMLLTRTDRRTRRARAMVRGTFATWLAMARLAGLLRLDLTSLDALRAAGPLVLAPNHPCLLDAILVISRLPDVACIMKAGLMANPFLGGGARLAGYIVNDSARTMIRRAVAALREGAQVLVFPEGTRTVHPPFDEPTGAFALIAVRAQAPVQLILIEADSGYLGKGWPIWRRPPLPLGYRVRLGPRIEAGLDVTDLVARVRAAFLAELSAAPAASGAERPAPAPLPAQAGRAPDAAIDDAAR